MEHQPHRNDVNIHEAVDDDSSSVPSLVNPWKELTSEVASELWSSKGLDSWILGVPAFDCLLEFD